MKIWLALLALVLGASAACNNQYNCNICVDQSEVGVGCHWCMKSSSYPDAGGGECRSGANLCLSSEFSGYADNVSECPKYSEVQLLRSCLDCVESSSSHVWCSNSASSETSSGECVYARSSYQYSTCGDVYTYTFTSPYQCPGYVPTNPPTTKPPTTTPPPTTQPPTQPPTSAPTSTTMPIQSEGMSTTEVAIVSIVAVVGAAVVLAVITYIRRRSQPSEATPLLTASSAGLNAEA